MSPFIPVSSRRLGLSALALLAATVFLAPCPVHATPYVVKLVPISYHGQANYVQAYASGAFDLSGLTFVGNVGPCVSCTPLPDEIGASNGILSTGLPSSFLTGGALYAGASGPAGFGIGHRTPTFFGTGDPVDLDASLNGPPTLRLPQGYVSGAELASGAIWDNQTFFGLGVTPGTYTWTWGPAAEQSFTIMIPRPVTAVPEPAAFGMFGLGVLLIGGFATLRRRHWRQAGSNT